MPGVTGLRDSDVKQLGIQACGENEGIEEVDTERDKDGIVTSRSYELNWQGEK